ncbi:MAG: prephenate dehydrogenase/arogenate dehydrogenase family protein [Spongiibacteraceae bacterium]|nr:prephenate dehydrogenase/arogenate dehydrogenase family protein [Spongiibacteraceae bacterium]MBN4055598.1 prephenate dehydrogenase/arogenate dehydrogenase family protein [bacterium AH-315-K03]
MTATVGRITVLALGLIGGSLAKAIKENGFAREVVGWGRGEASLKKGLELGVIDRYSLDLFEAVDGADIVVIATPTLVCAQMLHQLAKVVNSNTVITDVASVKGSLLSAAHDAFGAVPANLVLAHPIAGSEKSGVAAARPDLFVNHRVIVTPTDETSLDALRLVKQMWESTGAQISEMSVGEHDEVLAATSHLPHILAYSLVDALTGHKEKQDIFRYAAGGFRDFTRIASSDPVMWQEIALANRESILTMIDVFSEHLQGIRAAIDSGDGDTLLSSFKRAKQSRDDFAERLARQRRGTNSDN